MLEKLRWLGLQVSVYIQELFYSPDHNDHNHAYVLILLILQAAMMLVVRESTHTVWQLGALTSVMRSTRVFKKREIVSVPHLISFPPAGGAQLNYLNCRTINSPPPTPVFDLSSPFPLFHSRCLCICPCCLCQLHSWITSTFDVIHELRALSALRCLRCLGYAQYACTCTCS